MQALSDTALIDIWERGRGRGPVERALLLLAAALPEPADEDRAELSIGERNAEVVKLRRATFGDRLPGCVPCPACGQHLEFELDAGRLSAGAPVTRQFALGDALRFRLPNSRDLLAAAHCEDVDAAAQMLAQRCCVDGRQARHWPPALVAEVEMQMAALQDAADVALSLNCAACGYAWTEPFDICAYFWEELEYRVGRLIDDVHRLALVYGWDEQRILTMSDARRAAYLERCDA